MGIEEWVGKVHVGDCREVLKQMPPESVDLVIYSPPYYGLRDYGEGAVTTWSDGWVGQLGLEPDWRMYVEHLIEVNKLVKRVLKKTGSLYIVIGDSYAGSHCGRGDKRDVQNFRRMHMYDKASPQEKAVGYQPKCLMGIPWRLAFAMIEDGWILRNAIIWYKPNHMPESVKDRLTKTYEYVFHFVKSQKYYYNLDMIREEPKTWIELLTRDVKPFGKKGSPSHRVAPVWESYSVKHDLAVGRSLDASYDDPLHLKEKFLRGLKLVYEEMERSGYEYDSKYSKHEYGQNLQGFVREQSLAKMREASRRVAERLFPDNPVLQQKFVNWVHDHAGNLKGKNPGDLWAINTRPFKGAHFAVYPIDLVLRPILSSCPPDGVVLDPMCGSGTTLVACELINRRMWDEFRIPVNEYARKTDWRLKWIGIEINPEYAKIAEERLKPFLSQKTLMEV